MNLNYAIFRSQQIMTLNDLAQIGSHNKREKQAYKSNPDIKLELRDNNIEIVPLESKYVKGFKELTKEYEKEHNKRQKTERQERLIVKCLINQEMLLQMNYYLLLPINFLKI